ncbi:MAG: hypothetical protein JXB15_13545 [Anaerolineales bacterium]|nr:hypothetical protein [Anaerolineales bacterium]
MGKSRLFQLIFLAGLILFSIALWLAGLTIGDGHYEPDLYAAYSPAFWISLAAVLVCGFGILFGEVMTKEPHYGWVRGALLIALTNLLIILIPFLRDYAATTQWDSIMHTSRVDAILTHNHIDAANFYPVAHLLAAAFSFFTGLRVNATVVLFPAIFYVYYLANLILMAWTLDDRPHVRGLIVGLGLPLVFGTWSTIFRPMQLAFYSLPLFIAWLVLSRFQKKSTAYTIPLLLILIALPFVHPWAVVSMTAILVILGIIAWITRSPDAKIRPRGIAHLIILMDVPWLAWFGRFGVFNWVIQLLFQSILLIPEISLARFFSNSVQRANISLAKVLSLIFSTYGQILLYMIPVGLALLWMIYCLLRRNRSIPLHIWVIATFVMLFGLVSVLSLFTNMASYSPLRILSIAIVIMPALIATWFLSLQESKGWIRWLSQGVLYITITGAAVLGMLNSYDSPRTGYSNLQFSYAQQAGVVFTVNYKADDFRRVYLIWRTFQLESALNYTDYMKFLRNYPNFYQAMVPAHFGHGEDYMRQVFSNAGYMWISAYERAVYNQVWQQGGRFTPDDFIALENDIAWHKIYTSGDMTVWRRFQKMSFSLGK